MRIVNYILGLPAWDKFKLKSRFKIVIAFRLLLLHYFAEILCPVLPMLPLVSREDFDDGAVLDSNGVLCGNQDKLRGVLLASAKEAAFRKVTIHHSC